MSVTNFRAGIKNMTWYATTFEGSEKVSKMMITKNDSRILFFLLSKIDLDNRVSMPSYKEIGEELKIKESTVKKAMMNLRKNDILIKDIEQVKTVFINPDLFYAGYSSANDAKKSYYDKCKTTYDDNRKNLQTPQ